MMLSMLLLLLIVSVESVDAPGVEAFPSMLREAKPMLLLRMLLLLQLSPTGNFNAFDGGRRAAATGMRAGGFAVSRHGRGLMWILLLPLLLLLLFLVEDGVETSELPRDAGSCLLGWKDGRRWGLFAFNTRVEFDH